MHFPTVPVEAARRNSVFPPPERTRPLVLVVDDEPLIAETLAAILNAKGFAALTAVNAAEALETSALMPPELLITDVSMPEMNGFDLAIEVMKTAQDCKVIFFTGHLNLAEVCTEIGEMGKGCVMMLKPVHPLDLLECVHEVVRRRCCANDDESYSRSQSLYGFLSSVVRGEQTNPLAWKQTARHSLRTADAVA